MQNHSYENEFGLQVHFPSNQTHFHNKGFATKAQGNSEIAYCNVRLGGRKSILFSRSSGSLCSSSLQIDSVTVIFPVSKLYNYSVVC